MKDHLDDLAEYFNGLEFPEFADTANWFSMAWAIKTTEYERAKYVYELDPYQVANEYMQATQKLRTKLMDNIARFLYMYMGFESLLNNLTLDPCPNNDGKINAATYYIKVNSSLVPSLTHYEDYINLLKELIINSSLHDLESLFSTNSCTCEKGMGLKVLYRLRNKLSHGNFEFPMDEDISAFMPLEPEITKLCSRLLLISIQIIMIVQRNGDYSPGHFPNIEFDDELEFLSNCHLS